MIYTEDVQQRRDEVYRLIIETMEEFGDIWTVEQVKDVYSKKTLEEAIADRSLPMQSLQTLSELLLTDNLTVRYGII